jgi:hypothetical protein
MQIFRRNDYNQLWITLQSNEILGLLDSSYIQDYYGVQGQVSLLNTETQQRTPVLMSEDTSTTPDISHDVFSGYIDLSELSDGLYKVEGMVRDVAGNYTILSQVQNPTGQENTIVFDVKITNHQVSIDFSAGKILMGMLLSSPLPSIIFEMNTKIMKVSQFASKINKVSLFSIFVVKYLGMPSGIQKTISFNAVVPKTIELQTDMNYG